MPRLQISNLLEGRAMYESIEVKNARHILHFIHPHNFSPRSRLSIIHNFESLASSFGRTSAMFHHVVQIPHSPPPLTFCSSLPLSLHTTSLLPSVPSSSCENPPLHTGLLILNRSIITYPFYFRLTYPTFYNYRFQNSSIVQWLLLLLLTRLHRLLRSRSFTGIGAWEMFLLVHLLVPRVNPFMTLHLRLPIPGLSIVMVGGHPFIWLLGLSLCLF